MKWEPARYGDSWTMRLAGGRLELAVHREIGTRGGPPPPYGVTVFGCRLSRKFDTAEEAKAIAIKSAQRLVRDAAAELGEFTS